MLHIKKLIERRFPRSAPKIIGTLFVLSASALAVGVGMMLLQ